MNHVSMRQLISSLVDGALGTDDVETVRRHLESCAECRQYEQGLRLLRAGIRASADAELSVQFTGNVVRAVRRETEEVRSWFPAEQAARRLVLALSVVAVLLVSVATMAGPEDPVMMGPYLAEEPADSSVSRSLLTKETISKDDVLLAALTRQ